MKAVKKPSSKKTTSAKKISKEELKELQKHISTLNSIVSQVGEIEARKFYAMQAHKEGEDKLRALRKHLLDKYGNVNINPQTGEISAKEDVAKN